LLIIHSFLSIYYITRSDIGLMFRDIHLTHFDRLRYLEWCILLWEEVLLYLIQWYHCWTKTWSNFPLSNLVTKL